jgi:hypothetical protein
MERRTGNLSFSHLQTFTQSEMDMNLYVVSGLTVVNTPLVFLPLLLRRQEENQSLVIRTFRLNYNHVVG